MPLAVSMIVDKNDVYIQNEIMVLYSPLDLPASKTIVPLIL